MFNKYYENELYKLREQATAFAKEHPITAPLLMGPTMDPGAERMLEGMAFLSGMLNKKLENEFNKFIRDITELVYPQIVRPIPSTSVILFEQKPGQNSPITIQAETPLASKKIEDTSCVFQTSFDVEIHPIKVISTTLKKIQEETAHLEVQIELNGSPLEKWQPQDGLYFFLGGTYTRASYIYMLLNNNLKRIMLKTSDGEQYILPKNNFEQVGLDVNNKLIDFPTQSFSTFSLLQEYFILPHKFFFSKISGLDKWQNRGKTNKFSLIFEITNITEDLPPVNNDTLIFNTVPIINLFKYEMDPIRLDHLSEKVHLQPNSSNPGHYQIYNIESVFSYQSGSSEPKEYVPVSSNLGHQKNNFTYQIIRERSIINNMPEVNLFFPYKETLKNLQPETLVVTAKCTNNRLAEKLKVGDICRHTFESPESLLFRNILQPTYAIEPPAESTYLWSFISSLSLNFLSLGNLDNLKTILKLFIPAEDQDRPRSIANQKRIEGIASIKISAIDKIQRGRIMRGQNIEVEVDQHQFAGIGDVYLFGCVLNNFFSAYASINTFTQFTLKESNSGVCFKWPTKIGNKILI